MKVRPLALWIAAGVLALAFGPSVLALLGAIGGPGRSGPGGGGGRLTFTPIDAMVAIAIALLAARALAGKPDRGRRIRR